MKPNKKNKKSTIVIQNSLKIIKKTKEQTHHVAEDKNFFKKKTF